MGTDARRPKNFGLFNREGHPLNLYHLSDHNRCPNCAGLQWHVGRVTAECANCGTVLPLPTVAGQSQRPMFLVRKSATAEN